MKKLFNTFAKIPLRNKVKMVVLFPFILVLAMLEELADLILWLLDVLVENVYYRWKEIVGITFLGIAFVVACICIIHWNMTVPTFRGNSVAEAEKYVYKYSHEMSNNYIEAEDGRVRGYVRADDENIKKLIEVIETYRIKDGNQLKSWLLEFKDDDYSNAVEFHNYCWTKLDGEVGWAIKLRDYK